MILQGFVGPSYVSTSPNVARETLRNWYPQTVEASEPARIVYMPRPGLSVYASLSEFPIRCLFQQDGRCFAVGGKSLFELFENGSPIRRGALSAYDALPATINSSGTAGHQLYITSGGKGDIFDTIANTITPITAYGYPPNTPMGTYLDTYFLTIKGSSAQFNISDLLNGLSWSALDFAVRIQASDNLVGIIQFNKIIFLIGSQTSEPWYDSGAASFPFQSVPQVLIEVGCCAPFTIMRASSGVCWLHRSERGQGIFVATASGDYTPHRISTYALEAIWSRYPTITDAVAHGLTWEGHEFALVHFPSGKETWAYDFTESVNQQMPIWSNWSFWNPTSGSHERFRGWVHCQAFGGNLVGDWENGNVYKLDGSLATDDNQPIIWERTSPHLNNEQVMAFFANAQIDMETGLGGSTPQAMLDWSNDGGHTFGSVYLMSTGAIGEYLTRCRLPGSLGQGRNRVYRLRVSNDAPPRLLNFYMDVERGTN